MSKSLGNTVAPQDVMKQSGADILRMWVMRVGLCRRHPHRPGDPQDHGRYLPQAAQHDPLDARQPRAFPPRGPRRGRADARARAADAAPPRRARRAGAPGLCRVRLQAHLRGAQPVHDRRSLGVLLRHPQGRALLRSLFVADAQGRAHRDRPAVPLHRDLARADAVLHRRGGVALALSGRGRPRCISSCSPSCRRRGATRRWRRNGARSATVRRVVTGALEVERAAKRIGSSLEAAPIVYVSDADLFAALVEIDLAEVCDHLGRDAGRGRGAGGGVPACPRSPGVAVVPKLAEGRSARARGKSPRRRLRPGLSRRDAARRAGAARMGRDAKRRKAAE